MAPPAAPLLSAHALRVPAPGREGRPLLEGPLDLEIYPGEILGLAGPSGCGKSTTLRVLAGLESRAEGTLRFLGHAIPPAGMPSFRRRVIYLPQRAPVFPGTARESLARVRAFASRIRMARSAGSSGHAEGRPDAWAEALATRLGLPEGILDHPLVELSVGENQRLGLVRALLLEPTVLLLDEATSALDPQARDLAEATILAWKREGERAAVLVSHDPQQRSRLCDRELSIGSER